MQALMFLLVGVVCLSAGAAGIVLYTRFTNSGERFRKVIRHKIDEFDPKPKQTQGLAVRCPECERETAGGRFCSSCGSPLF